MANRLGPSECIPGIIARIEFPLRAIEENLWARVVEEYVRVLHQQPSLPVRKNQRQAAQGMGVD
jgi:hypothetical protein